ncbi:MAG: 30S ribosomal protein S12 methylthiotransferase RimO [Ruminococcaceae bacterium]|nr:30S ribosomal protein S12 methylthiotransferase RimO [Oscillospiraceae bacterium]
MADKYKVGMLSLGCAKNQVDGEVLMAQLRDKGFELSDDVGICDIAIVNTCGFIDSAKQESIEEILELVTLKNEGRIKKVVVTGCLSERYKEEIMKDIPEVDGVFGIGANACLGDKLYEMMEKGKLQYFPDKEDMPLSGDRVLTTPSYYAYLKIAEGCDNCCTYCAIPEIRGKYRSRPMEDIIAEAEALVANGAKELNIIAQDTSRYGLDIYGKYSLAELLTELCQLKNLKWIRVLYLYPDAITDELLDVMAKEEKIVKYMDIPLQHASGNILKKMNRRGNRESLIALVNKIREKIPGIVLRTTFIAGFPGETEEDFEELCKFVKEIKFDRMGCFAYSQEEGTAAALLPDQIDEEVKERRAEIIYDIQQRIMEEKSEEFIGKTLEVMTEGFDRYAECYFGRSAMDAPDVDGKIFFTFNNRRPAYGQIVKVVIEDAMDCDLTGSMVD